MIGGDQELAIVAGDKGFCVGISFFFFWKVRVNDYAWIIEYLNITIEYYVGIYYFN